MNKRTLVLGLGSWVVGGGAGYLVARGGNALKDRWRQNSGLEPEDKATKSHSVRQTTVRGVAVGGATLYGFRKKLGLD